METRGFLRVVGASFLLFAVGSVLTISAYADTGSPPPPPPPPPTSTPSPPQTTSPPPVTTTPTTTTTTTATTTTTTTTTPQTQPSPGSSSGSKVRVHHKVKQHTQTTHKKKHPANPQTTLKPATTTVMPKAVVPVSSTSGNGVLQFAAVAAIVAAALVVLALLALVISVAVVRMRGPHGARGGNINIR
jgi:hypothetical protein